MPIQPPKRKQPSSQTPRSRPKSKQNQKQKQKPKSTQSHNLTTTEILESFRLFATADPSSAPHDNDYEDDGEDDQFRGTRGIISAADTQRALKALGLPKAPPDILSAFEEDEDDGEDEDAPPSGLRAAQFADLARTMAELKAAQTPLPRAGTDPAGESGDEMTREIDHAFALFTHNIPLPEAEVLRGEAERNITLADLRRVAGMLREDVDDTVLRGMLEEAGGEAGGVGRREFEGVMRRAGVF